MPLNSLPVFSPSLREVFAALTVGAVLRKVGLFGQYFLDAFSYRSRQRVTLVNGADVAHPVILAHPPVNLFGKGSVIELLLNEIHLDTRVKGFIF